MATQFGKPTWSRRRVALVIGLGLHWLCVVIWALPDHAWRDRLVRLALPLPQLNTHQGEVSFGVATQPAIQAYLMATSQTQRWRVFSPRRPNVAFLEFEYALADGDTLRRRLTGPAGKAGYLTPRWRFLEWGLGNPDRRTTFVPRAQPALARAFGIHGPASVQTTKWAYPVPLLRDDGTGNPRFESASAWRQRTGQATGFVGIDLGRVALERP